MPHHALLYRAPAVSRETALSLVSLLEASEVEYVEVSGFGIDDVRALTTVAYRTPSIGSRLGVVVILQTITVEAEQALLKLLEEPPLTTGFLFCVPESVFLLPTLLSRFNEVTPALSREETEEFIDLAKLPLPLRIADITKRLAAKDLLWQQKVKQGLIAYLDKRRGGLSGESLAALYYVAEHLLTRGANNKQLLEEMAFTIPFAPEKENGTLVK